MCRAGSQCAVGRIRDEEAADVARRASCTPGRRAAGAAAANVRATEPRRSQERTCRHRRPHCLPSRRRARTGSAGPAPAGRARAAPGPRPRAGRAGRIARRICGSARSVHGWMSCMSTIAPGAGRDHVAHDRARPSPSAGRRPRRPTRTPRRARASARRVGGASCSSYGARNSRGRHPSCLQRRVLRARELEPDDPARHLVRRGCDHVWLPTAPSRDFRARDVRPVVQAVADDEERRVRARCAQHARAAAA